MVTINPADCKPGEVYEGTVHGVERTVLIRRDASHSYPWESLGEVLDHEDVSSLVRLAPAREVTRQDLPDMYAAYSKVIGSDCGDLTPSDLGPVLDAVVAHLNANGGTPVVMGQAANNMLWETLTNVETDRDRWRRAHSIVEQERDQARESLRRLRDETDFDLFTVRDQLKQCRGEREQMTRDRDEWRTRAEAAEARTAPAVTKAEVEKVIDEALEKLDNGDWIPTAAADAVWSLVSGSDPAVFVVRESDVAAVEVTRGSHDEWFADGEHVYVDDARQADHFANGYMTKAVRRFAVARAIEAESADQVEQKAVAAFKEAWHEADREGDAGNRTVRGIRAARHVLGQEADDE